MAIKDIAVAYNGTENADKAVDLALQMCRKYGAALTGVYAANPVRFEGNVAHWVTDEVMQTLRKAEAEVTKSIGESFAKRVASAPPNGEAEFFSSEGESNVILARQARYHDILVMGQFTVPGDAGRHIRAEDLVLRTGRPIIVVPHSYEVREFQEYAVVGWDGSRQSARALSDAMQILETKKRLDIVTVRSADDDRPAPDSSAVVRHLERHGVEAKHLALSAMREGVGQTLLNYCADNQPDVLVTGAYGHTKLREDLFGGVTRYIMENMTIPVLMSH